MIKPHPVTNRKKGGGHAYNSGSIIKAINLVVQGYAELLHSCKNCNPYHIEYSEINREDYQKPFKLDPDWHKNTQGNNCIYYDEERRDC